MSRLKYTLYVFAGLLASPLVLAHGSFWHMSENLHARPLVTLSSGPVFTSDAGGTHTFPVIFGSNYFYTRDKSNETRGIVGAFAGYVLPLYSNWEMQAGLAAYASWYDSNGLLLQGPDSASSDLYNYHYDINSTQLLVESKFSYNAFQIYHPYLSAGLGVAFNRAKNYSTSVPPFLTFTPMFADHLEHSFTYNAGLGMDVDIPCNWRLGVGYRFSDLGKVRLGAGHIDTVPIGGTLEQKHLYVHELLAQLTYLF
jgi:opacity protein-like surface antigen